MSPRIIRNWALPVSELNATIKCRECEIFIGPGHEDAVPIPAPDGAGVVCRSCLAALERRARRQEHTPVRWDSAV